MKLNNKGTTLVEITAGFLMMAVIFTSFIKIIELSSEMTSAAIDMKNNSIAFEEQYYKGQNNKTSDNKYAFRTASEGMVIAGTTVSITEWHKQNDGYFQEWHKGTDGKFKTFTTINGNAIIGESYLVSDCAIVQIENVHDKNKSRKKVFRYTFTN